LLTFNDDIQGTSAVALGAVLSAVNVTGKRLKDQQIVMFGAGSAGIGVADGLRQAMKGEGVLEHEARSHFWIIDKDGLLYSDGTTLLQNKWSMPSPRAAFRDGPELPTVTLGWRT
jgi:malate dehydrogenase (oxaloacetate-decarboxylating)